MLFLLLRIFEQVGFFCFLLSRTQTPFPTNKLLRDEVELQQGVENIFSDLRKMPKM